MFIQNGRNHFNHQHSVTSKKTRIIDYTFVEVSKPAEHMFLLMDLASGGLMLKSHFIRMKCVGRGCIG